MDSDQEGVSSVGRLGCDEIDVEEIMASAEDCEIVLFYNRIRFIVVMTRSDSAVDGDVATEWLTRLENSLTDPDESVYDLCLEDLRESAISACKDMIHSLSASVPPGTQRSESLEDYIHPTTICLQLHSFQGRLQSCLLHESAQYVDMFSPTGLSEDLRSQPGLATFHARDLAVVANLYMGQVLKVSNHGKICVFKSAHVGNCNQLEREIQTLYRVSELWKVRGPTQPMIPKFLGIVMSQNQVVGLLEDFVDGENLSELDMSTTTRAQRSKWQQQIEEYIRMLHLDNVIWGDVKAENVLIDRDRQPWLIDFGGSYTNGWVDEHLAESVEGDLQGLRWLREFLDL